MALDLLERRGKARGALGEFARVVAGEAGQKLATFAGDAEDGAATVFLIDGAFEKAFALAAVDELYGAVVLEAEALSGVGDGDGGGCGRAGDLEQELMLLWMEAGGKGGVLTEVGEGAKVVAELGEGLEESGFCRWGECLSCWGGCLLLSLQFISYHDIN